MKTLLYVFVLFFVIHFVYEYYHLTYHSSKSQVSLLRSQKIVFGG